ncbi:hypothetical protein [Miltoncostaea marina]|uniref:hypothetical protein n=1 Tax=Miltoncostaea marina TaxID=2843215 RepID=UPI001C3E1564|nr:hypothetical protein [Miltoncostaea marina]
MTRRPAAILAGALAALAAWAGAAAGHGTTTVPATTPGPVAHGALSGLAAAGDAGDGDAAATLAETDAGMLAPSVHPSGGGFDGGMGGWTAADQAIGLCTISSGHTGDHGGSLRAGYAALLNLLGLLGECRTSWRSPSFTWTGGAPAAVAFSMDRLVDVNGLLNLVTVRWTAVLVDETAPGERVLLGGVRAADEGWTTQSATGLGADAIAHGHTYHVRIDVRIESALSLVTGIGFGADEVALTITPQDHRADAEIRASGVPRGSTHTLELAARTTGEPFDVRLWDGAGWATRATVSGAGPAWQPVAIGLTPGEWNGGTVRVRLVATGAGPDDTADALSLEHARVVATGGITVSGPTSVILPPVALTGLAPAVTSAALGPIEVVDTGGAAPGWSLTATATRWRLDGRPGETLPEDALSAAPVAPWSPDGSDLSGVAAGAGGVLAASPAELMRAAAGGGVGTYRQSPLLSLVVPITAMRGVYRSEITLSAG